jgi:nanoRNase/pAp phosphatase (c-di-AMP/oligoRNAs hydrolase)
MSFTPQEQLKKFLKDSKEILLLIEENPTVDAIGSAWGLYHFLEKMKKSPSVAFSNRPAEKLNFLPRPERIFTEISGARDFVLSFDTTRNKIMAARSEEKDGRFNIFVTPEKGAVDPRDFSFILAKFKYDLLIAIGCADLEKLGSLYAKNPDLFFEVPLANIDHRSENENFGQINLVDVTASSSSEIIFSFLESWKPELIDQKIATCFLAGIIGETESFQKKNTTPKTMAVASELMNKKADQQEIVRWLYKTQPLRILKLWGRAMAKINWEEDLKMIWSEITVEDFVNSRSKPEDIPFIIEKLKENYHEGKIFMFIYNDTPQSSVAVWETRDTQIAQKIAAATEGISKRNLWEMKIAQANLSLGAQEIIKKMKSSLRTN